jgi:hypothetical protein
MVPKRYYQNNSTSIPQTIKVEEKIDPPIMSPTQSEMQYIIQLNVI